VLHSWCLFIDFNDSSSYSFVNNGGCQTYQTLTLDNGCWLPPTTHHCSFLLWQCQGATNVAPAALFDSHMAAIFFDNGSHIIGNIPTGHTIHLGSSIPNLIPFVEILVKFWIRCSLLWVWFLDCLDICNLEWIVVCFHIWSLMNCGLICYGLLHKWCMSF